MATLKPTIGPLAINHLGQLPAVTISFDLKPGVSLSQALAEIRRTTADMRMPATIIGTFQGAAQAFQASLQGMGVLLVLAIFVIYLVLGILYESFIHPLTILSGLPTAGFGALVTLWLFGIDLNMYAFVGIIMLVGIVKKNAIMMIDFAIEGAAQGAQGARRRDLPGVHHALSPDHDDHDGGADGQPADRAGARRRRRGAAAAGARGRRRAGRIADADALHHAGDLPVFRAPAHLAGDARRARGGGTITGGLRRHLIAERSVAARA